MRVLKPPGPGPSPVARVRSEGLPVLYVRDPYYLNLPTFVASRQNLSRAIRLKETRQLGRYWCNLGPPPALAYRGYHETTLKGNATLNDKMFAYRQLFFAIVILTG